MVALNEWNRKAEITVVERVKTYEEFGFEKHKWRLTTYLKRVINRVKQNIVNQHQHHLIHNLIFFFPTGNFFHQDINWFNWSLQTARTNVRLSHHWYMVLSFVCIYLYLYGGTLEISKLSVCICMKF